MAWNMCHIALRNGIIFTNKYNVFIADMLHHAVILLFDSLTLNFFSVSAATWSNSVPTVGEIEQSA